MKLSKAISGFLLFKSGEGLSKQTLKTYESRLKRFADFLGDVDL